MKRIAGAFTLLLAGLCGCISFTQPSQADAKRDATEPKHSRGMAYGQIPPATTTLPNGTE